VAWFSQAYVVTDLLGILSRIIFQSYPMMLKIYLTVLLFNLDITILQCVYIFRHIHYA